MKTRGIIPVLALAALAALAVAVGVGSVGCSKSLKSQFLPNERPVVRLTAAPVDTTKEEFYVYKMDWVGYDPDGRVVRFQYAVDPPTRPLAETLWVSTPKNEEIIQFPASKPESLNTVQPRSQGFHVFVVRAVDNLGAVSAPVARAFFSYAVAPTVQIDTPKPSALLSPTVSPAVRITWSGKDYIDPAGFLSEKPVRYKFKLFKKTVDIPWDTWAQEPDSIRRTFAPTFTGWDSTGPDSAQVQYTNLVPGSQYMFVVVALSRSGAYSPIFTRDSNVLTFAVGFAGQLGPQITMYNSFFSFTYPSGGFPSPLDPSWAVQLQVPSDTTVTFNWFADPGPGSEVRRYRWVLDLVNLDDETQRSSQDDWYHWSPWSLGTTATVGPFHGAGGDTGEVHNFYLEAEDINGLVSIGWIQFRVFRPSFTPDDGTLLVVNDTRMFVDQLVPGALDSLKKPIGTWPTRAELDTFLFAVGGVRWKMTPTGTLSPPGIFQGYRYDTLGTRHGQPDPTIPLSLIGRYSHVVWMTDAIGATYEPGIVGEPPSGSLQPQTTLRYMCDPNRQNTLAIWVGEGGQLWGLGGGFGTATNGPWDKRANNAGSVLTFSTVQPGADLGPGRFMFDICHWRSEWRFYGPINAQFARFDQPDPNPQNPALGPKWPGYPFANPSVDYSGLPPQMLPKDPTTDPIWPFRTNADFYVNNTRYSSSGVDVEFISLENRITETRPVPGNPDATFEVSTLDTVFIAYGPKYPTRMLQQGEGVNATMTYYHGGENAPMLFTGFDIWHYRRQDCVALVNWVLGTLWHLPRTTLYSSRAAAPAAAYRAGTAPFQPSVVRPARRPVQRPAPGAIWPNLNTQPRRGSLNGGRHE